MSFMLGKELVDFIQNNKLEETVVQTEWVDQLVFSVFLDEEHLKELEYNWNFDGEHLIRYFEWSPDGEIVDPIIERNDLSTLEALKLRGLAD